MSPLQKALAPAERGALLRVFIEIIARSNAPRSSVFNFYRGFYYELSEDDPFAVSGRARHSVRAAVWLTRNGAHRVTRPKKSFCYPL